MNQQPGARPPMSRTKKLLIGGAAVVCAPVVIAGMISGAKQATSPTSSDAHSPAAATAATSAAAKPIAKDTPTKAKAPVVSASDPAVVDAAFAATVQTDEPSLQQFGYAQLAQTGRKICADVRGGATVKDEATPLIATYGAKGAGVLLEVAPDAYCKALKPGIEQQLQALP